MSIELEIGANTNNELTLDEDDIESINPVKTHTGVGDFSASIAGNRSVEEYAKRQDRVNIKSEGTVFFTGYLLKVSHNKQRGTTRIQGRGIGKKLQETRPDYDALGGSLTYTNIALEDAIDNYWTRTPFSASVTSQNTQIVESGTTLQDVSTTSEFKSLFTIPDDTPATITNGKIKQEQSAFVFEAESENLLSNNTVTRPAFSSDEGANYTDADNGNNAFSLSISPNYDMSNPVAFLRGDNSGSGTLTFELNVGGSAQGNITFNAGTNIHYETESLPSLSAGSHTINFEANFSQSGADGDIDIVGVYDADYNHDDSGAGNSFDNTDLSTVNRDHLNSPTEFASEVQLVSDFTTTSLNITKATVSVSANDTTGEQALGLNFEAGTGFDERQNTTSHTAAPADATRQVRTRVSLSRHPPLTNPRNTKTPRFGYKGQNISSLEIVVDINNLVVIDELELSKNHFDNLQTLHEYGDFLFVIEHDDADIGNLTVNSFQRGDETRSIPSLTTNAINKTPKIDSSQYYNSIFVQGALVSGSRPTAEAKDSTAIANDRGEISPGVLRDLDVVTSGGAEFRAQSLLDKAQKNSALRGQKVTRAVDLSPGYAYAVDFGDGLTEITAEEVSISKGTDRAETTLDFIPRSDISQDIAELRRNARKTEDQV